MYPRPLPSGSRFSALQYQLVRGGSRNNLKHRVLLEPYVYSTLTTREEPHPPLLFVALVQDPSSLTAYHFHPFGFRLPIWRSQSPPPASAHYLSEGMSSIALPPLPADTHNLIRFCNFWSNAPCGHLLQRGGFCAPLTRLRTCARDPRSRLL